MKNVNDKLNDVPLPLRSDVFVFAMISKMWEDASVDEKCDDVQELSVDQLRRNIAVDALLRYFIDRTRSKKLWDNPMAVDIKLLLKCFTLELLSYAKTYEWEFLVPKPGMSAYHAYDQPWRDWVHQVIQYPEAWLTCLQLYNPIVPQGLYFKEIVSHFSVGWNVYFNNSGWGIAPAEPTEEMIHQAMNVYLCFRKKWASVEDETWV